MPLFVDFIQRHADVILLPFSADAERYADDVAPL